MTVPSSVMVECPICKEETLHEVLSGRVGGKAEAILDSTVKCRQCGHVHHKVLKVEKPIEVPVVVSWLKESKRTSVMLGPDEVVNVDDEIMCGDLPVMITSIEKGGARVRRAKARGIVTIWAKRFDKVHVHFSVNKSGKTYAEVLDAVPDEEFFIGDILNIGGRDAVIHSIKLKNHSIRMGSALARDIVRVYASVVRKTYT
ncbi:MAG: hypothetical protein MUE55_02990 [Thermoplasmata archaeon]|nr:hypothetical protein [Thermoplasmata archaeon]